MSLKPYTHKAKKALDNANRLSKSMNYNFVGTEHILAGLLKEGTGVAAEVLMANNVELDKILNMIEELISPDTDVAVIDRDGESPRTQKVVENASDLAERFHCEKPGTEHLLLALVSSVDCAALRLLNTLGLDIQKLYLDTITAMGGDPNQFKDELQK